MTDPIDPTGIASALAANAAFYKAFQAMDMDAMSAVWSHGPAVRCVHPGWEPLCGWDDVKSGFIAIFSGQGWLRVAPAEVEVQVLGEVAWVSCVEVVSAVSAAGTSQARVAATNLFHREGGQWRMVLHHGSPVAGSEDLTLLDPDHYS